MSCVLTDAAAAASERRLPVETLLDIDPAAPRICCGPLPLLPLRCCCCCCCAAWRRLARPAIPPSPVRAAMALLLLPKDLRHTRTRTQICSPTDMHIRSQVSYKQNGCSDRPAIKSSQCEYNSFIALSDLREGCESGCTPKSMPLVNDDDLSRLPAVPLTTVPPAAAA